MSHELQSNAEGLPPVAGKAMGAFVALAAGDALGWPNEFRHRVIRPDVEALAVSTNFVDWVRRSGTHFCYFEEPIHAGGYSDDTQLTLAVARSRLLPGMSWWSVFSQTEIPLWTLYERGGGGALKRAARSWCDGVAPWRAQGGRKSAYFDAGGNGVAMRVIPHAVFYAGESTPHNLLHDVMADGIVTHGHPRALVGAAIFAYVAWWLLRLQHTIKFGELIDTLIGDDGIWGGLPELNIPEAGWRDAANQAYADDYATAWQNAVHESRELLRRVRTELQNGVLADDIQILKKLGAFGATKGSGTISAISALYLVARYAAQPAHAVLRAAFMGGTDTDTIASMVGGLAGCLAGTAWLPVEWSAVQDYHYLKNLAKTVVRGPEGVDDASKPLHAVRRSQLASLRRHLAAGQDRALCIDGVREADVVETHELRTQSKSGTARSWVLQAKDGQTLYLTKVSKERIKNRPEVRESHSPEPRCENKPAGRVAGVVLHVKDLVRAEAFYRQVFGLVPRGHETNIVFFDTLTLVETHSMPDTIQDNHYHKNGLPPPKIRILVGNLTETHKLLRQAGGRCARGTMPRRIQKMAFQCHDLDGNLIEVSEQPTHDGTAPHNLLPFFDAS